jgi:[acyl-carrier-protein] S-malonyltransferase
MWGAVFPGQGSQSVGMGKFLFENFQSTKQLFEEASDTLKQDFKKLCFEGPEADLSLTENTQPALLLVSTATFRAVQETCGLKLTAGAGHSIGEYAAVVAAGSLKFSDAIKAVRIRGQEMQKAVPVGQGGMCAVIGLTDEQTAKLCAWVEAESEFKPLQPANFNAPGQVVISGTAKAIEWLQANPPKDLFAPESPKLRLIPLKVSAPFHCAMMKPAEEAMRFVLNDLRFERAQWPIVQNLSATESTDPERLRTELIGQISGAVKWTQCVQRLSALGVSRVVEFGTGKVLSGLVKKIDSNGIAAFNINSLDELKNLENAARG